MRVGGVGNGRGLGLLLGFLREVRRVVLRVPFFLRSREGEQPKGLVALVWCCCRAKLSSGRGVRRKLLLMLGVLVAGVAIC